MRRHGLHSAHRLEKINRNLLQRGFCWKGDLRRTDGRVHYRHAAGSPARSKWTPSNEQLEALQARKKEAKRRKTEGGAVAKRKRALAWSKDNSFSK